MPSFYLEFTLQDILAGHSGIDLYILYGQAAVLVKQDETPNFVFFLVDDLGWMDIGANGSTFYETPSIDKLASEGIRFTQAYAASPVCSPTRASILTGRNPARINLTQWIGGPGNPDYLRNLPLEEVLFPEILKEAGYKNIFLREMAPE